MNPINTSKLVGQVESRAKNVLLGEPGLKLALLFGSMASGKPRGDSDVDLAVLFDRPITASDKMELIARLEGAMGRPVDLVDLFFLSGTILKQILREGRVLVQDESDCLSGQIHKMVFNQADMMPYTTRALKERQRRFAHG